MDHYQKQVKSEAKHLKSSQLLRKVQLPEEDQDEILKNVLFCNERLGRTGVSKN